MGTWIDEYRRPPKPRDRQSFASGISRRPGALTRKVRRYRPGIVALLGITMYRITYGAELSLPTRIPLGPTSSEIAGVPIFLLPNPSGRNAHYSYKDMLDAFRTLQRIAGQSAMPDM